MITPVKRSTPQNALQSASEGVSKPDHRQRRRAVWKGKAVPQYPDDGNRYRRPTTNQIANAFAAPNPEHWVNIWLRRLAIMDPARYSALRASFADKGKAGLHACAFTSIKPCRQCGGTGRYAVGNQCTTCNKAVRYGKPTKASETEMIKREQKAQAKASAEHSKTELAGFPGGWMFKQEGQRTEVVHPVKTHGRPVLLDADRIGQNMMDTQFRILYQWACHNRALPEGALYQAL